MCQILGYDQFEPMLRAVLPLVLNRQLREVVNLLLAVLTDWRGARNCEHGKLGARLLKDVDACRRLFVDNYLDRASSTQQRSLVARADWRQAAGGRRGTE